jgi:hypothetical protein
MGLLDKVKKNGVAPAPPVPTEAPNTAARKMPPIEDEAPSAPALEQGATYLLPTGVLAVFNAGTMGKNSFSPVVGGAPILLEKNAEVRKIEMPAAPKAEVAAEAPTKPKFGLKLSLKKPEPVAEAAAPEEAKAEPVVETKSEEAPVEVPAEAPKKRGRPKKTEQTATEEKTEGIQLYVNAIPPGPFETLDGYVAELTGALQELHNVPDIRFPPNGEHPLAYGKWKGALASAVRAAPPGAGSYVVFTKGNEIWEVAAEALAPLASVTRGV